jgi:uncharacterized protein (TIRG00374 family)
MAVYAAYLINFTVPRAGEIARASILANYEGIPFEKGFGTIIAERVADTLMLGVVIVLAMVFQYDFLKYFFFRTNRVVLIYFHTPDSFGCSCWQYLPYWKI